MACVTLGTLGQARLCRNMLGVGMRVLSSMMCGLFSLLPVSALATPGSGQGQGQGQGQGVATTSSPSRAPSGAPGQGSARSPGRGIPGARGGGVGIPLWAGPPGSRVQLADGTAQVYGVNGDLIGEVLTRPVTGIKAMKQETWIFEPGTLFGEELRFDVEPTMTTEIFEIGDIQDAWAAALADAPSDWVHVCLNVQYALVGKLGGSPTNVISSLAAPVLSTYELRINGNPRAWLLRGVEQDGTLGELYGFLPTYIPPDLDDVLTFAPADLGVQDVSDYVGFLQGEGVSTVGMVSASAPSAFDASLVCDTPAAVSGLLGP